MTFLVYYILLILRTPSNGSLRPICLIRSSLQFDFILVYYEVTILLRRLTFYCNWRTISFYCIALYCVETRAGHWEIYDSIKELNEAQI